MDTTKPAKTILKNKKILWTVVTVLCIGIIVTVALLYSDEEETNSNQRVMVENTNVQSTNTSNDVATTITNGTNTDSTGNTNATQVVVEDDANTNQISANANTNPIANTNTNTSQEVITNTQQEIPVTATTIDDTAIQLMPKQTGYCEALAPADWSFVSNADATGADLFSPDQSQHAGWGIAGVYTYMYPDVDSFLTTWLGYAFTGSFDTGNITLGNFLELDGGFIQRDFTTSTGRTGVAIYKTYNFGDPTMYVVSVYMADTTSDIWQSSGAIPFSAAISIRCVSQLRPTTSSVDVSTADPSSSSDNPEVSLSDQWTEAIMGYENVYSPSTGDHYEAPLTSQWETGPEGSGYYRTLPGGGYEKLERGFGNY